MNTTRNENSLQTAVRWGGNALLIGGAAALLFYVMCWPFFILHAIWLTATGQHQKRNEIMAHLSSSGTMRFIYGAGCVLMSIPCFVMLAVFHNLIDPNDSMGLLAWWEKNCGNVMLWLFVYPIVGVMIFAAAVTMISGIAQSIKAAFTKTGKKTGPPLVSFKVVVLAFYMLALPAQAVLMLLFWSQGVNHGEQLNEIREYMLLCERLIVMFTAFLAFRFGLPKLMVNSTPSVHLHTAWIMAILMYPVYYSILIKSGVYDLVYGMFLNGMNARFGI